MMYWCFAGQRPSCSTKPRPTARPSKAWSGRLRNSWAFQWSLPLAGPCSRVKGLLDLVPGEGLEVRVPG